MRQQLRARRDLLLDSVEAHAPQVHVEHVPVGGLNLWVRLPDGMDVDHLVRECETRGLLVAPGSEWFPAEPSGPFIRLNFSSESPAASGRPVNCWATRCARSPSRRAVAGGARNIRSCRESRT